MRKFGEVQPAEGLLPSVEIAHQRLDACRQSNLVQHHRAQISGDVPDLDNDGAVEFNEIAQFFGAPIECHPWAF